MMRFLVAAYLGPSLSVAVSSLGRDTGYQKILLSIY